jgi:hypothetical protein
MKMNPSRFSEGVKVAADNFVAGNFSDKDAGKNAQERIDTRSAATFGENGVSVDSTTTAEGLRLATERRQTHELTERPTPELTKAAPELQAAAWEMNVATEEQGDSKEVLKGSFDVIKEAREQVFENLNVPAAELKIDGLIGLTNPATTEIQKANLLTSSEVKEFVSLDSPENNLRWQTGNPQADAEKNTSRLVEALYGHDLNDFIEAFVDEKVTNSEGGPPPSAENLRAKVEEAIKDPVTGLTMPPEAYELESVNYLVSQTIKVLLIENPDKVTEILAQLAQVGELDLDTITGFRATFEKQLIKHTLDCLETDPANSQYFDYTSSADTATAKARAKGNRKAIYERLINPTATGTVAIQKMTTAGSQGITVTAINARTEWNELATSGDIKLNPNSTTADPDANPTNFDHYINVDAFIGEAFQSPSNSEIRFLLSVLGKAMTANQDDAGLLFKAIYDNPMTDGTSGTDSLKRSAAFAEAMYTIKERQASGTPMTDPNSANDIIEILESICSPERLLQRTQYEVTERVDTLLRGLVALPPELTGLRIATLRSQLENQINQGSIESTFLERLSAIAVALPETERNQMLSEIRALANIEIVRAIASETSEEAVGGVKYTQHLAALMNRFVFNDSGTASAATSEQLSEQLIDLMHAKATDKEALKIKIGTNGDMQSYVKALLAPGASIESELTLSGSRSKGSAFVKAHQLLGIVRRGTESGEWLALRGSTDPEIKQYLVDNFGIKADSEQLTEALERFKSVALGTGATVAAFNLPQLISSAKDGSNSLYGKHYTNMMRLMRANIIHGGELDQMLKAEVHQKIDNFMGALQTQANPELATLEGDALAERNRVLGLEEQRAAVYENYDALDKKTGIEKFFAVVKKALPRIGKAMIFPAIAMAPMLVPALAALAPVLAPAGLIVGAGLRIVGAYTLLTKGLPQVVNAVKAGNWKAGIAAAAGLGVNAFLYTVLPPSIPQMLAIVGVEALGVAGANEISLSNEAKRVVEAFNTYDIRTKAYIDTLDHTTPEGDERLQKLADSLNVTVVRTAGAIDDPVALKANILTARNTARTANNMALLQGYSNLIEEYAAPDAKVLRDKNLEAKRIMSETQQVIVGYGIGSGLGKLGTKMIKDASAGVEGQEGFWNSLKGGVLSGLGLGALELGDQSPEATNETGSQLTQLDKSLEDNYDAIAEENELVNKGDNNILAIGENPDGETVALIDADGDNRGDFLLELSEGSGNQAGQPVLSNNVQGYVTDDGDAVLSTDPAILKTQLIAFSGNDDVTISPAPAGASDSVSAIVEIGDKDYVLVDQGDGNVELHEAKLEYVTTTTTESAGTGGEVTYSEIYVEAGDGTMGNQWSMVEDLYRQAAPGLKDQQYYTLTANSINEVGGAQLYSYMDRLGGSGPVVDGDQLSLDNLQEAAPNEFAKFLQLAERNNLEVASNATTTTTSTEVVTNDVLTVQTVSDTTEFTFEEGRGSLQSGILFASGPGGNHYIFENGAVVATIPYATTTIASAIGDGTQADDPQAVAQSDDNDTPAQDAIPAQPATDPEAQSNGILKQFGIAGGAAVATEAVDSTPENSIQPVSDTTPEASETPAAADTTSTATQPVIAEEEVSSRFHASDDPTDMIVINNQPSADFLKGFFDGGGREVFESTVDKIYIHGDGGEVELDVNEIDIKRIDPEDKIVYHLKDGSRQVIDLHDRKVDFVFKGNLDERVDMEGGNLLDKMNTSMGKLSQFAEESNTTLSELLTSTEDVIEETNEAVIETKAQTQSAWNKLGNFGNSPMFNPGYGLGIDYSLHPDTVYTNPDGDNFTITSYTIGEADPIDVESVRQITPHSITYMDPQTGELETFTDLDNELVGLLEHKDATGSSYATVQLPDGFDSAPNDQEIKAEMVFKPVTDPWWVK